MKAALAFSILISTKHLFLTLAPAVFFIILRRHCFNPRGFLPLRFLTVGTLTLGVIVPPFLPILFKTARPPSENAAKVLSRLFPFDRGLTHAYWAPNFWALYAFADRALLKVGFTPLRPVISGTSGLISDLGFGVLPNIPGWFCALLTLGGMFPALAALWRRPGLKAVPALALCSMTAFQLGYHVHEKAVMNVLYLLYLSCETEGDARLLLNFGFQAGVSFLPLWLGGGAMKVALIMAWQALSWRISGLDLNATDVIVHTVVLLEVILGEVARRLAKSMEFLPLMIYSVLGASLNLFFWGLIWRKALGTRS